MPGYVIHIATAQEYLKKHEKEYSIDFIPDKESVELASIFTDPHVKFPPLLFLIDGVAGFVLSIFNT